jgi:hypothetical protein
VESRQLCCGRLGRLSQWLLFPQSIVFYTSILDKIDRDFYTTFVYNIAVMHINGVNCSMGIGIFEGKKAYNNQLVLEVLFKEGPTKSWAIAKKMSPRSKSMERTQDIYSVLIRKKKGRLRELEEKGYIATIDGIYELTIKGIIATLIKNPRLELELNPHYLKFDLSKPPFNIFVKRDYEVPFVRAKISAEKMRQILKVSLNVLVSTKSYNVMAKETKKLIEKGFQLDELEAEDLLFLLFSRTPEFEKVLIEAVMGSSQKKDTHTI